MKLSLAWLASAFCFASVLAAAEPSVRSVDVRGLQIAGKTTITVDGADLGTEPRLLLPFADAKVTLKPGGLATKAVFEIELSEKVEPGVYQFRLGTNDGVSAPVVIAADRLPQLVFAAEVKSVPVSLHGSIAGSAVVETRFSGKKNDDVTVEVEAQRLGSKLRPVLHLLDANRKQLAWSWPARNLIGDTRLSLKLPADGGYIVQLHDVEYNAAAPSFYRLKIGSWHFAEVAFPPAIERGKSSPVTLVGRMPSGRVEMNSKGAGQVMAAGWPTGSAASGPRVTVLVSDFPEHVEQTGSAAPQEVPSLPAAINGRLLTPGEQDRFRLTVNPGDKLRLDLFAERLGSPIDAVLVIEDAAGKQLARGDDSPGSTDAALDYTVPDKTTTITVAISDLLGRGGDSSIYRLVISPATATTAQDFRLLTNSDRMRLTKDGRTLVPVLLERRGYQGAVKITAASLPAGVKLEGGEIPAGGVGCLLTFSGGNVPSIHLLTLRGQDDAGKITRDVVFDQHPLGDLQPWLRSELALAVTPDEKFRVEWASSFSADAALTLADKLPLPVTVTRPEGEATAVRLSLITAQVAPKVNNTPDPNRTLKVEKPIEIAPDKADGDTTLLVPFDLPAPVYDVAVMGELLSKDKKTVLAVAYTQPRRLSVRNPLLLQLASATAEEAINAKAATTVKLKGKIERGTGLKGAVTVSLAGQPTGVKGDNVIVKEDASDFEFAIVFPAGTKAGEVTGAKLAASIVPDPSKATQILKAKEIPLNIKLVEK